MEVDKVCDLSVFSSYTLWPVNAALPEIEKNTLISAEFYKLQNICNKQILTFNKTWI